jgi:hypothetical protein
VALVSTNATCKKSGFYQHEARWHNDNKNKQDNGAPNINGANSVAAPDDHVNAALISPVITIAESPSITTTVPSSVSTLTPSSLVEHQKQNALLDHIPEWMDKEKTRQSMFKRKRMSGTQAVLLRNRNNMHAFHYGKRYNAAYKRATLEMKLLLDSGKRGTGVCTVIARINSDMLNSPNDKLLTKTIIHDAVSRGEFGVSPPRKGGKPTVVSNELTCAIALHVVMMQVCDEGEASTLLMHLFISALTDGTTHQNMHNDEYVWRLMRERHAKIMNPSQQLNSEDR